MRLRLISWLYGIAGVFLILGLLSSACYSLGEREEVRVPRGAVLALATRDVPTPASTAAVIAPTETPLPTLTPTPVGGGGILVFDWEQAGNRDLYAIDLAGDGQPIRLTDHPDVDRAPAWSPDGQFIAFTSRRNHNWDLYLLHVASGTVSRLTQNPHYDGAPAWSPDGQFLAFESTREGDLDIFILSLADGTVTQVTRDPAPDYGPAWSPDGRQIAFVSWRNGDADIFLASPEGQFAPFNLTDHPANEDTPIWMDTGRLSFRSEQTGVPQMFVVNSQQHTVSTRPGMRQVVPAVRHMRSVTPSLSPDGRWIAYVYTSRLGDDILLASPDGEGAPLYLWRSKTAIGGLSWSAYAGPLAGKASPTPAPSLYTERVGRVIPPYDLKYLPGVDAPNARLSDRVDDSFLALRKRVRLETGYDFLGTLSDAWRPIHSPRGGGASYLSWHKAGRAFDTLTEFRAPSGRDLLVIVREDEGEPWGKTFWRLYLRTARQDGSMGEPLKQAPWDFYARFLDEKAHAAGGRPLVPPAGYYVDFTALAQAYGWQRIPALDFYGHSWVEEWSASEYWHFEKRDGLSWQDAMLELYDEETFYKYFSPAAGGNPVLPDRAVRGR